MEFFFNPKGIAVVGASPEPLRGGRNLIENLLLGYDGPKYPVNPKYREVLGLRCYPTVLDIPDPPDLALIFIPAPGVPDILRQCVAKGVRGVIIESSGFAEVGPNGKALQDECLAIARRSGLRIWGPNCMGLIDTRRQYVFSFITPDAWQGVLNPGGVSLIVQSGLLAGGFITTLMSNRILALSKVCSIGNKCDVEESEILEYFLQDPDTRAIGLYLESFPRGRRFFDLAQGAAKPIVLLKGGKSASGARASASHTGSLAGNYAVIEGALEQAGVHRADDFFEMIDLARCLEKNFKIQNSPDRKPRIAILTYSGAAGIVTSDHMEKEELSLADFSPQTQSRLEALSPDWMPVKNPLDFWPAMEKNGPVPTYREALAALHQDPQVDGIIVHLFAGFGVWFLDMKEVLLGIRGPRKPILFWVMGHDKGFQATRMALEDEGWPVLTEIHRLVRVMAQLFKTREITGSTLGTKEIKFPPGPEKKPAAPRNSDTPILDEYQSKQWLRSIGLAVVADEPVRHLTEALTAAEKLGYPVVLKGIQEGKVHKTEAGLVRLNLRNPEELSRAFMEMGKGDSGLGHFLIQPMLKGGAELIAGVIRDPQFGPAVMLGLGGVWAEVYKDVVFRLAPVTAGDVLQMVESLRGKALLKGFRNSTPVDLELLAEWLIGLGQMALSDGRIREIDVNPLLVVEGKPVAVDASIILGEG